MKKVLIISFLMIFGFATIVMGSDNTISDLVTEKGLTTPNKISNWLVRNINPTPETGLRDYWQTPLETLESKIGDCEDYAFLTQALLKEIDIISTVVIMDSAVYGATHAVTFFIYEGKWRIFDVDKIWTFPKDYKTIEDIVYRYYDGTLYYKLTEYPTNKPEHNSELTPDIEKMLEEVAQEALEEWLEILKDGTLDKVYDGKF